MSEEERQARKNPISDLIELRKGFVGRREWLVLLTDRFRTRFETIMYINNKLQQENKELKENKKKIISYITKHKQHEYRNGRNDEMYLELNQLELNELLYLIWNGDK